MIKIFLIYNKGVYDMAIKIQTQKTEIPVEIGELNFNFDVSDDGIKQFRINATNIQKEFHSIGKSVDDEKAIEQAKDVLGRGFEILLGKDSFDEIYNLHPSIMTCMNYFVQLVSGIEQELQNMGLSQSQQDLARKYIAQNK